MTTCMWTCAFSWGRGRLTWLISSIHHHRPLSLPKSGQLLPISLHKRSGKQRDTIGNLRRGLPPMLHSGPRSTEAAAAACSSIMPFALSRDFFSFFLSGALLHLVEGDVTIPRVYLQYSLGRPLNSSRLLRRGFGVECDCIAAPRSVNTLGASSLRLMVTHSAAA